MPTSHKPQVFCKQGFRVTKAIFCLLGKSPLRSGPRKTEVHRTSCARSGCFNGNSCQNFGKHASQVFLIVAAFAKVSSKLELWLIARRKNRSESSPRLQKTLTCACGLHAFCSPRLYAFSSLRSAGHCTGQS